VRIEQGDGLAGGEHEHTAVADAFERQGRRLRWLTDSVEPCDDDVFPGDVMF
jgi:hypothetical protein